MEPNIDVYKRQVVEGCIGSDVAGHVHLPFENRGIATAIGEQPSAESESLQRTFLKMVRRPEGELVVGHVGQSFRHQ